MNNTMSLASQLQEIGMSDKEARIYVALLEVGKATANDLSIKSGIKRVTAYTILENFSKRGLASKHDKHKKMYYAIEKPARILNLLEKEKEIVEFKIKLVREFLPELEMLEKITGEKATVRFYEGREGIRLIQKDIAESKAKNTCEIYNINIAVKDFPPSEHDHRQVLKKQKQTGKEIAVYDPKEPIPELPLVPSCERRYMPQNKIPFPAEMVIYGNKVVLVSNKGKWMGVIIENKGIVDGLRFLFDLAWQGAEKFALLKDIKNKKP